MWPDRAQGAFFPSAFPGLPVCWNVGRLGIFTARIFPSQSDRFQLEPGDSSRRGRGCRRGRGQMWGSPSCSALGAWTRFPSSLGNANICRPIGPGQGEPGLLELRGSGEAVGGLGDQRLNLSEARTWLAVSHRASLPPDGKCVRKGCCLGFHPQVGLCLPDPGSRACRGHPALAGGSIAEFVTCIRPPLCGPHSTSRAWFPLLVTFPAPVPSAL